MTPLLYAPPLYAQPPPPSPLPPVFLPDTSLPYALPYACSVTCPASVYPSPAARRPLRIRPGLLLRRPLREKFTRVRVRVRVRVRWGGTMLQTRLAEVGQDRVRRAAATHHLGDGDDDAEGLSVAKLSVK